MEGIETLFVPIVEFPRARVEIDALLWKGLKQGSLRYTSCDKKRLMLRLMPCYGRGLKLYCAGLVIFGKKG